MKLLTDDNLFGIQLSNVDSTLSRIRLILGDVVIGDYEPAIVWGGLAALARLNKVDDERLDPTQASAPSRIRDVLVSDEDLHEACLVQLGESFDAWRVRGYIYSGRVVLLYVKGPSLQSSEPMLVLVPISDFEDVVRLAMAYIRANQSSAT